MAYAAWRVAVDVDVMKTGILYLNSAYKDPRLLRRDAQQKVFYLDSLYAGAHAAQLITFCLDAP
jgi:hypothetical protein